MIKKRQTQTPDPHQGDPKRVDKGSDMAAQARRRGQMPKPDSTLGAEDVRALQAVELMFYAYRDFTSDPDEILAAH
jgi:hypothetical protein